MKTCMRHMEPYGYSNFDPICRDPACAHLVAKYNELEEKVTHQRRVYQETRRPQINEDDEEMDVDSD